MTVRAHPRRWWARLGRGDNAAQLVEFAVSLPLLVVFVVGIFDFSSAFTLKQKLTNIARDAARGAAAQPITDLSAGGPPGSVGSTFWVVDKYLQINHIDDCGIGPGNNTPTLPATWTYSMTATGCALTITINRGYYLPATAGALPAGDCLTPQSAGGQTAVIATCVNLTYAYQWRFARAASLLGATATLPATISATAVAMNEN